MDIETLRKRRTENLANITKGLENTGSKSYEDDRIWKPDVDKAGNGSAIIRFLDITEGDSLPWQRMFSYSINVAGRYYIEDSPTTIGDERDPVYEYNKELWDSTPDDDDSPQRKQARRQKRQLKFFSNILVINDPQHPENNGKVFLYKYGKSIHDKIIGKLKPQFEDETPINVFDYWKGADFRLRVKLKEAKIGKKTVMMPNYEDSAFNETPSRVAETDEEILAIAKQQYSLEELVDPKHFKSYEELTKKLDWVLHGNPSKRRDDDGSGGSPQEEVGGPEEDPRKPQGEPAPRLESEVEDATKAPQEPAEEPLKPASFDADDDDAAMDYFRKIAQGTG